MLPSPSAKLSIQDEDLSRMFDADRPSMCDTATGADGPFMCDAATQVNFPSMRDVAAQVQFIDTNCEPASPVYQQKKSGTSNGSNNGTNGRRTPTTAANQRLANGVRFLFDKGPPAPVVLGNTPNARNCSIQSEDSRDGSRGTKMTGVNSNRSNQSRMTGTNSTGSTGSTSTWASRIRDAMPFITFSRASRAVLPSRRSLDDAAQSHQINSVAKRNMHFANPVLFRGARTWVMLRYGGRILGNKPCTAEYYKLSTSVRYIDTFISHNWSTPRLPKFMVLALHFNLLKAFVISLFAAVLMCTFVVQQGLPTFEVTYQDRSSQSGLWCTLIAYPIFIVAMFFAHEVGGHLGCRGRTVFLDKACVHQEDEDLKRQAIESLSAFLFYSWNMVAVYSDVYLQKLWTMYEVASFLVLHPGSKIVIRPVFMPRLVLLGSFTVFLFVVATQVLYGSDTQNTYSVRGLDWASFFLLCAFSVPSSFVLRWWARKQAQIYDHVNKFRVRDAICFSETDRSLVEGNIVAFMKYFSIVPENASDLEVFVAFEQMMREQVPMMLEHSFGRVGIPYAYILAIFLPTVFGGLDQLSGLILNGEALLPIIVWLMVVVANFFAICPIITAFLNWIAWNSLDFDTYGLAVGAAGVSFLGIFVSAQIIDQLLLWAADAVTSGIDLFRFACAIMSLFLLTYVIYRPPWVSHQYRRQVEDTAGETPSIKVTIISARGLRNADSRPGDLSDPFCVFEIQGKPETRQRTRVVYDNLNPVWNHVALLHEFSCGDTLSFKVLDEDKLGHADHLGDAVLSYESMRHDGFAGQNMFDGELPLASAGKGITASLNVKVTSVYAAASGEIEDEIHEENSRNSFLKRCLGNSEEMLVA